MRRMRTAFSSKKEVASGSFFGKFPQKISPRSFFRELQQLVVTAAIATTAASAGVQQCSSAHRS
jgi:hypothetical protein